MLPLRLITEALLSDWDGSRVILGGIWKWNGLDSAESGSMAGIEEKLDEQIFGLGNSRCDILYRT